MNTLDVVRKPVHSKCFGIEIECLIPTAESDPRGKYYGFFFAGHDGSIRASWRNNHIGVEFVSQPLPYNMLQKELVRLGKRFPTWSVNESCGIHVHVSRSMVSTSKLRKFAVELSRLSNSELEILFGREPNEYCSRIREEEGVPHRYQMINFTKKATIEFRMFNSGDLKWAQECVRRTKLMCEFKGNPTFENLLELFTKPEKE